MEDESSESAAFQVTDLTVDDLDDIQWSGGPAHPEAVRAALLRVSAGEVEYLAVRGPDGSPVGIGGVDYTVHAPAGTIWQLVTREELRGQGIATRLVAELEDRMRRRGLATSMLGVEADNTGARNLYLRLGYRLCGHASESWEVEGTDGSRTTHFADVDLMNKTL